MSPSFLNRVVRETTDCATIAHELAAKFREADDTVGEKLAEYVCKTLVALAYDALDAPQSTE